MPIPRDQNRAGYLSLANHPKLRRNGVKHFRWSLDDINKKFDCYEMTLVIIS